MAVTRVQHVTNTNGGAVNSITGTFSAATAGNTLFAVVMSSPNGVFAGMDTPAGWTKIYQWANNANGNRPEITSYYKIAAGGETTVTMTDSTATAGNFAIVVNEYSGMTGTPLDQAGSAGSMAGDSATSSVGSLTSGTTGTLTQSAEYCIAMWAFRGNGSSATYSNSYTEDAFLAVNIDTATPGTLMVATLEVNSTTAQESTATWTSPLGRAVSQIITFKVSTPPAPLLTRRPRLVQPMFRATY